MKRMMIIGGPGAGKTWLATRLADLTCLPLIHIDKFYFTPGWKMRPSEEIQSLVREAAKGDAWIIEGNNSDTFSDRVARADHLIFVDFPTWLRLWGSINRTLRYFGRVRPDMADGCSENFDPKLLKLVVRYGRRHRWLAVQLMHDAPPSVTCVHLTSRRQTQRFVEKLQQSDHSDHGTDGVDHA